MDNLIQVGKQLLNPEQFNKGKYKTWQLLCERQLKALYDTDIALEFTEFLRGGAVIRRGMDPYQEIYRPRIEQAIEFLESLQLTNIPAQVQEATAELSRDSGLTQNFYLTQSQVQEVNTEIDFSSYDSEVQKNIALLLNELKKKSGQDKSKVANIVKWLADKSIDVLIALITRPS